MKYLFQLSPMPVLNLSLIDGEEVHFVLLRQTPAEVKDVHPGPIGQGVRESKRDNQNPFHRLMETLYTTGPLSQKTVSHLAVRPSTCSGGTANYLISNGT